MRSWGQLSGDGGETDLIGLVSLQDETRENSFSLSSGVIEKRPYEKAAICKPRREPLSVTTILAP